MTWKQVVNADSGTADLAGGNDWDKLMQQLSGTDNDIVKLPVDYIDFNQITEPASPSSGYIRMYMDSADAKLKIKRSNGDVVIVE